MTLFADEVYDTLAPAAVPDEANGFVLRAYVQAIGEMFSQVEQLFRSTDPSTPTGAAVVDVDTAPDWWLPWLGQVFGVQVTSGVTPDAQRNEIRYLGGFKRGRVDALVQAVKATLTGNRTVLVYERSGGPYGLSVITYASETPNPTVTQAAAIAAKAAGRFPFSYAAVTGWVIALMESTYAGQTITDLEGAFASVKALESNTP